MQARAGPLGASRGNGERLRHVDAHRHHRKAQSHADAQVVSPHYANAATRATEQFFAHWHARDWDGALGTFAETARIVDRRALIGTDATGDALVAGFRAIFDMGSTHWQGALMATRGVAPRGA